MDKHTDRESLQNGQQNRDHPEQYPTDQPSLFDMWESERHVDAIPVEELKISQDDEKDKSHTKDQSSSARKYHSGFEK
ncbi:hypothetical protein FHS18_002694 [Paenibacillus phyllosphaerae]|uniref:Uncharacterized protein n=1 Tax=Paenibacillus phyllosphaerae TaxID=274593 RepID=A0A7W5AXX5_9BACL|nr:hypothetical protein [Paenibacillus phyllosphaerae]MBB3110627.1 hypothetical protein [Paenibacillus phyllosphaerae]